MKTTVHYVKPLSVALFTALSITFSGSVFAVAGKFQFVNGEVQVIDTAGKSRLAQKGGAIDEGETVSSSGNGFAQIKMEDGGFFAVRPDTEFKVDTFQFNGKEDGSEKGVFSLIKGSLRSVTGLIGKKHKDNYKIQTATSTIGIRGSGADVGHSDSLGTAVLTLFGGHSLTSGGKTIITGPGQTALAPPGQEPRFVPSFPFNTSVSTSVQAKPSSDKPAGGTSDKSKDNKPAAGEKTAASDAKKEEGKVVVPVEAKTRSGQKIDLTENVVVDPITGNKAPITGNAIVDSSGNVTPVPPSGSHVILPAGEYGHFITAVRTAFSGPGFIGVEQSNIGRTDPVSNYILDSNGVLVSVTNSALTVFDASGPLYDPGTMTYFRDIPSSLQVISGTGSDAYHTPDGSIYIGRSSNIAVNTVCAVCSGTDTFISAHAVLGLATAPALVQTLTGNVNYTLAGSTHPTDAFGNVGTLNGASIVANFTNQTVDFGVDLTINNKTLLAGAAGVPIVAEGFEKHGLIASCTGTGCGGGYVADIGGGFFGNAAASAALAYTLWPSSDLYSFSDHIQGVAAFTNGSAPTAIPSVAGTVGGGGAAVGYLSGSGGTFPGPFNDFNVVDNVKFAARQDLSGNLIAFTKESTMNGDLSFGVGGGSVTQLGADGALGVVWGRWSGYNAHQHYNGVNNNLAPSGDMLFITATRITTGAELGNYASFTGTGLSMGNTVGTYNLVGGNANNGSITAASATVNFSSNTITNFSATGSGGSGAFGAWNVTGSGLIADFMAKNGTHGIAVSGGGVSGHATGGFVGAQAQGLISTLGLTDGTYRLGGTVYMKR